MGVSFDSLVEYARAYAPWNKTEYIPCVKQYLEKIVNKSALFEFPLLAEQIWPASGKSKEEYDRYLLDYLELSAKYNSFCLMPFQLTAVEDRDSVVVFDNIKSNEYLLTFCQHTPSLEEMAGNPKSALLMPPLSDDMSLTLIGCAHLLVGKPFDPYLSPVNSDNNWPIKVLPQFRDALINKNRVPFINAVANSYSEVHDTANMATAYLRQVIYIMDPANFILRKESKQSRVFKEKSEAKKINILRKTQVRPHYVILSAEDTQEFLKKESGEPRAIHPVRGHWKTLISDYWAHKKGQRVYVRQHFRGKGAVETTNGWTYEVMVKQNPDKIVPFSHLQDDDGSMPIITS